MRILIEVMAGPHQGQTFAFDRHDTFLVGRSRRAHFRLPTEDLEKMFLKESAAAGFDGLRGHRAVGGMRASIYNAFPEAGVDALVSFMSDFERRRG